MLPKGVSVLILAPEGVYMLRDAASRRSFLVSGVSVTNAGKDDAAVFFVFVFIVQSLQQRYSPSPIREAQGV